MEQIDIMPVILTHNDCYKGNKGMKPAGIVVHSTAANNKYLKRYVQDPDNPEVQKKLGINKNGNHWNQPNFYKCVHAMIGLDAHGRRQVCQTLPWNYRPWGCGSGSKGSYNTSHIQFEMLEDDLTSKEYALETWAKAVELCAYLCKQFNLDPSTIVSHKEARALGYASNHGDPEHWMKLYGYTMNQFREDVRSIIYNRKKGDVDGDGEITAKDYIMAKRYVLGSLKLDEASKWAADMDGDGKVSAFDYIRLKRMVLNNNHNCGNK